MKWALSWKDMLPLPALIVMLDKVFFPKWHQVLAAWLSNCPNYEDITKWYMGWKAVFPENLLAHPIIKGGYIYHYKSNEKNFVG